MTNFDSLKEGDKLSETTYYEVISKNVNGIHGHSLNVKTSQGQQISITKDIVEKSLLSASQYTSEVKLSQTELAELLSNTNGKVFEVNFQKQATSSSVNEAVSSINNGKIATNSQIRNSIGIAFRGETRTLRGYLVSVEPLMGRAKVIDLDVKFKSQDAEKGNTQGVTQLLDNGYRLVDLRHINYIIFEGVKYSLKK